jgi:hypothetical protein
MGSTLENVSRGYPIPSANCSRRLSTYSGKGLEDIGNPVRDR